MERNRETIRKSLDELFEELNLQNHKYTVTQDLISLSDDSNVNSIEFIQSSDNLNSSWTVKIFEVVNNKNNLLDEIPIPSRTENNNLNVKEYIRQHLLNFLNR